MMIHNKRNQVSFHIYILQMQRSPTRPLNSACRDGRPNTLALGPNTLVQGPNTLVPGPNSRAQHEGMAPGPSLLISNMQTGLLPSSHRTIMIHCKSGQVFLFSLWAAPTTTRLAPQKTKRSKSRNAEFFVFVPQGRAEKKSGDVPGYIWQIIYFSSHKNARCNLCI